MMPRQKLPNIIFRNPEIKDIQTLFAVKEGEDYHIEMKLEIDPSLTVAQADDIKDRIRKRILEMKGVTHVIIEFDEDDGIRTWDGTHPWTFMKIELLIEKGVSHHLSNF